MIDHIYDFDNQFFRMVSIGLAKTMTKSIRWINYFEPLDDNTTGRMRTVVPFYTSLTGDERFVMDAFVDDIVDKRVSLNTDQYQRGTITFTNFSTKSNEFANPNQFLAQKTDINGVMRKIISKVKAVPVTLNFDIEIQLATQNEIDKCSQKIMNMFFNYMFFNIDYFGLKIDAMLKLPDDKSIEIPREMSMDSDTRKTIKFSLSVDSYFPIFQIDSDDLIVCDNDDDFDWERIGVPKPSLTWPPSNAQQFNLKRVYWDSYYHELSRIDVVSKERGDNPKTWVKEDFDISPVQPGKSKPDNDI